MSGDEPRLDPSAYLVLGMVRLGARSGYEIKQTVELSLRFFWTISPAQIYPSLERLEKAGLIRGASAPVGGRQRRTFEITESGEKALRAWLRAPEAMPFELRDLGMVKLFFADALGADGALALLGQIRGRSQRQIATLHAIEPAALASERKGAAFPMLTLHMGIAFHQAILDVCGEFEDRLLAASRQPSG
jgi:DNA-binding PadR family transcriptional regulator